MPQMWVTVMLAEMKMNVNSIRSLSGANCEWNNDTCQLIDGFTNEKKQLTNMFQGFTYPDEYVYLQ